LVALFPGPSERALSLGSTQFSPINRLKRFPWDGLYGRDWLLVAYHQYTIIPKVSEK